MAANPKQLEQFRGGKTKLQSFFEGWANKWGAALEPYTYTVYDRITGDFPAKHCIHTGLAKIVSIHRIYDLIFGDFPAKNTVHTELAKIV